MSFSRRSLFKAALGAGGAFALSPLTRILAQAPTDHRFVGCYLSGGWDVLMGPDPRDPAGRYGGIDVGTELLPSQYQDPFEVTLGGATTLLAAPMRELATHADRMTLFRGVNMNTVAHNTGRAYVNTGVRPAGSTARGSSLGTVMAASGELGPDGPIIPNVSLGMPSYNDSYTDEANAVTLNGPSEIAPLVSDHDQQFPAALEALLKDTQDSAESCIAPTYRRPSPAGELRISRERLRRLQLERVATRFAFDDDSSEMNLLRARYGFAPGANDRTPAKLAAAAGQLIESGLARSVTVRLQRGFDTHTNWGNLQPQRMELAMTALARLLDHLREGDPELQRTTVLVFSEFARTPRINGNRGRDHWFANSFMMFGSTLRPALFGATNEDDLGLLRVDPDTGRPAENGIELQPEHLAATLVGSLGLPTDPYRVDPLTALYA